MIANWFIENRVNALNFAFFYFTKLGSFNGYVAVILLLLIILFLKYKNWKVSAYSSLVVMLSFVLNLLLKNIFARPRPTVDHQIASVAEGSLSFPSGHSMTAAAFYGFLLLLGFDNVKSKSSRSLLTVVLGFLILLIGVSRIYLGVHYVSDVLAGFCAGAICAVIAFMLLRKIG